MKRRWSDFVSSRSARIATIVLLTAQLGGCAVSQKAVLVSFFCIAAPGDGLLETACAAVWLLLGFSWIAGLAALRLENLRPVYWLLILLIPIALAGQEWLLQRGLLYCDAP